MDTEATAHAAREVGRPKGDAAHRPRQNVYDDLGYEAADTIGAWSEAETEATIAPDSGPAYTGRA